MMKTAVKPTFKLKTFCRSKSYIRLKEKQVGYFGIKFYQKLLIVLISLSTILILPESPRELENICESHNFKKVCYVW